MKKQHNTIIKTMIAFTIFGIYSMAHAQNNDGGTVSTQVATSIVIPSYTDSQLASAGCDKPVWNKMVADYQVKAQTNAAIGSKIQVANQIQGAPSPSQIASCFDSAAQIINNATRAYNTISSILTGGGMDSSQLFAYAQKVAIGAACSQVNSYVNQSGIGTSIGQVNGGIGTVLNTGTNIGGVNTGSVGTILNNSGYDKNPSNNVPYVNSNQIGNAVGQTPGFAGALNNANPFK